MSILVVDDDRACARAVSRILREHRVTAAFSGREALGLLERGERFDAVVCDVMMPDMSGPTLHAAGRKRWPAQAERFVFITGGVFVDEVRQALGATGAQCLSKPIDVDRLSSALADLR